MTVQLADDHNNAYVRYDRALKRKIAERNRLIRLEKEYKTKSQNNGSESRSGQIKNINEARNNLRKLSNETTRLRVESERTRVEWLNFKRKLVEAANITEVSDKQVSVKNYNAGYILKYTLLDETKTRVIRTVILGSKLDIISETTKEKLKKVS